ncbi:MAG: hypothetical protein JW816_01875 [Candidatus Buchananbacteria bacterium]|nr:hypothetical protein [Candidatus Buchananbacteria bacterium]
MTDEKWQDIKWLVKDKFGIDVDDTQDLPEDEGPGIIEIIEFHGPLGKMRLTRTTKPLILEKKVLGSRRIGSDSSVQYKYSDTEKTYKFTVYRWDDTANDWVEMEKERGEMIF